MYSNITHQGCEKETRKVAEKRVKQKKVVRRKVREREEIKKKKTADA